MNEASSDAMKTIALASSSGRPRRPIGTPVTGAALFSCVPVKRVNMPVSVGPGDAVHTDSGLDDFERHRFGGGFDRVLAADKDRAPRHTLVPVGRGDVENAHFVLHVQEQAENIRVERRGIALRCLFGDRANLAFGSALFTATSRRPNRATVSSTRAR